MDTYAKKLIDTAILAGKILLESNAESYRVEDTMNYILKTSNFETCEALAMATGIFATMDDPSIEALTEVCRVTNKGINLNNIYKVNKISRQLVEQKITLDTAYAKLLVIDKHFQYSPQVKNFGLLMMCGFYTVLYGGQFLEMVAAFFAALILPITYKIDRHLGMGSFIINVLSLIPMVLIILFLKNHIFLTINASNAIIGAIMPLVPGTAITNAIRDTLRGDYNSGLARTLEAFVTALSVALGVALGLLIGGVDIL
ncbi:Uncharacterized membrane protein YjjP, DUF1212 family [Granulicatella balaenopterae]|uniref:Uncharacterized membrane protein YjjP, DUF1212 family n=1 Tax=Granulicatella balaenopterae TaxID=137733 RepID=A0A1H9MMM5_9LACT|nr:threonine/serine exporter family protein [Granulicatella balaenopterae]SER24942.1 Uncharacterized membrane protein YjjP, DUF1212 family [Granulicatella balaenopterae]